MLSEPVDFIYLLNTILLISRLSIMPVLWLPQAVSQCTYLKLCFKFWLSLYFYDQKDYFQLFQIPLSEGNKKLGSSILHICMASIKDKTNNIFKYSKNFSIYFSTCIYLSPSIPEIGRNILKQEVFVIHKCPW